MGFELSPFAFHLELRVQHFLADLINQKGDACHHNLEAALLDELDLILGVDLGESWQHLAEVDDLGQFWDHRGCELFPDQTWVVAVALGRNENVHFSIMSCQSNLIEDSLVNISHK